MSLYFLVNNFVFAFGMMGAIVFLMAAWLSFDAYRLRKDYLVLLRTVGFTLSALWYLVHSLTLGNDLLLYIVGLLGGLGVLCIMSSFLKKNDLIMHTIIVIPAFSLVSGYAYSASTIILFLISYLAFRQWKKEQNPTWIPFCISFLFLAISTFFLAFIQESNQTHPFFIAYLCFQFGGALSLGYWVWQYMRLRIRESFIMISVGVTFILATVVTLAFSTILIGRVINETAQNLTTDVKVLNLSIQSLKGEAFAKVENIAREEEIVAGLVKNNISDLTLLSENLLQKYNLGFLTIADPDGNVLVRAHALSRRGDSVSSERVFEEALRNHSYVTIEDSSVEGFSIRAGSPVLSKNKIVGVVIAGFSLDNPFVDKLKRDTGLEIFVYKDATSIAGTAFAPDGVKRLVGIRLADSNISTQVLGEGQIVTSNVFMYDEPFQASYSPLSNEDGKVVGMLSVAKHQQDIINIANATNRLTLLTVILILFVLCLPIYILAKRITFDS